MQLQKVIQNGPAVKKSVWPPRRQKDVESKVAAKEMALMVG